MGKVVRAVFAILLSLLGTAAVAAPMSKELDALRAVTESEQMANRLSKQHAISAADRQRAETLIDHDGLLLAWSEDQRVAISAALLGRLERAQALLEVALGAAGTDDRSARSVKAAAALGTVTGTVTDVATGNPIVGVRVQAFDFSTSTAPTGAGVVSSQVTNASGVYTLTLPAGKYQIRSTSGASVSAPGYLDQVYGLATPCRDNVQVYCTRYVGTLVTAADNTSASGINLALTRAGGISGTVRRADNSPLTSPGGIGVTAVSADGLFRGFGTADPTLGTYQVNGLPPGNYRVYTDVSNADLAGQQSAVRRASGMATSCSTAMGDCDYVQADLVAVTANAVTPAIDVVSPGVFATVTGTITTTELPAAPIAKATVTLVSEDGFTYGQADAINPAGNDFTSTGAAGVYTFSQVRPGTYRMFVSAPDHVSAAYPNHPCRDPLACNILAIGAPITISAGSNTFDMSLAAGATVKGTVTRAGGTPVAGVTVAVGNSEQGELASTVTDSSGNYSIGGLPDGVQRVYAHFPASSTTLPATLDLAETAYGDVPCPGADTGGCLGSGTPVRTSSATVASNVNITMISGGVITGLISDAVTGTKAPHNRTRIELSAVLAPGTPQAATYTYLFFQNRFNPTFVAYGLAPGAYKAVFASSSLLAYVDTAFGGAACPRGGCNQSLLPSVSVTAGTTLTGLNATLPRGSQISGTVLTSAGQPIVTLPFERYGNSSRAVGIYTASGTYASFGNVDGSGRFVTQTGLPDGTYFPGTFNLRTLQPTNPNFVDVMYGNLPCPYLSCGITSGSGLSISGANVSGVDLRVDAGGRISGRVTGTGAVPLDSVLVQAFDSAGRKVGDARTDPNGGYTISGLPTGSYYLTTSNQLGYLDEAYNNVPCEPFCNPVNSNAVAVTAPAITSGRDFALDPAATISGTVTDGGAAANVPVEIYGAVGNFIRSTTSSATGAYQFADLAAGRYYVRTRNATGRADALYSANPCVGNACVIRNGTPIDVAAGATASGINLALTAPATISGTITNQAGGAALSGISLQLLDARGAVAMSTTSSASGGYSFASLAAGNYYVVSRNTPGFIDESYNNVPCPAACNGLNGTPIAVGSGGSATANFQLSTGASISGTVRSGPSTPVPGAVVQVYNGTGTPVGQIATNASGNYQINALADGPYYVRSQNSLGFIDEVYNDRACSGYCDLLSGDAINISGAVSVGLIDFLLAPGGAISGTVTAAAGGAGIPVATVQAYDVNGLPAGTATTNAAGAYTISGLANGSYKVRTLNTAGYINQVYNGQSCSPSPCPLSGGAAVTVTGATVGGINFSLAAGGTISGTATDLFNNPLPTGAATLYNASGVDIATVAIANGHWEFNGLANGTYYVLIENNVGLVDQLYANQPCPAGACNITAVGTPIVLTGAGARVHVSNLLTGIATIDLRLPTGQTISGNVKDGTSNAPLANATVYLFNSGGSVVGEGTTDALGNFTSTGGLPPGTYYAATANGVTRGVGNGYVNALYSGSNCLLGCTVTAGTPIVVNAAPVTGINFSLAKGGSFGGFVKDNLGNPLALVTVQLVDASGKAAGSFSSNSLGRYSADGLPAGTYYARTVNVLGLQDVLYGNAPCSGNCNVLTSSPITITASPGNADADFTLAPQVNLFKDGFE